MSTVRNTDQALHELEAILSASPQGTLDSVDLEQRVREVLRLLTAEEPRWIGVQKARRLLGVMWDETVRARARIGILRGRAGANGQFQVRLDDVLYDRLVSEALLGIGGGELTPEELKILAEEAPGTRPWERERNSPSL